MLLSIIVPIYNCEKYLGVCLDSILNQGLPFGDFEVILINDGSTDRSQEIIDVYVEKYANFYSIVQLNEGPGPARNRGLRAAKGEYVYFLDADDSLNHGAIRVMVDKYIKPNPQVNIFIFNYSVIYEEQSLKNDWDNTSTLVFAGDNQTYVRQNGLNFFLWTCIIKRDYINRVHAEFPRLKYAEDFMFVLSLVKDPQSQLLKTDLKAYRYMIREGSVTREKRRPALYALIMDLFKVRDELVLMEKQQIFPQEAIERCLTNNSFKIFVYLIAGNFSLSQTRSVLETARKKKIVPILAPENKYHYFINRVYKYDFLVWVLSFFYRYLILEMHKKFPKMM